MQTGYLMKSKLIIEINNSEFQVIEYPLLELIVRYNDNGYETRYLALNEATMKTENGSTLVVDVNIRGKHFERFRGDGLCISTPSGSTAYNKALGGALIHPSLEAMQIAEIASLIIVCLELWDRLWYYQSIILV